MNVRGQRRDLTRAADFSAFFVFKRTRGLFFFRLTPEKRAGGGKECMTWRQLPRRVSPFVFVLGRG